MATTPRLPATSPWSPAHLITSCSVLAMSFVFGFQYLAVVVVVPEIAAELDGIRWYALAFAVPLATSVPGLVLSGWWTDRRGSRAPLAFGSLLFAASCVLAAAAPDMATFLVGRAGQGLGNGLLLVALYVVIAEAYPPALRARAFGVVTVAWLVPALVGPALAATIAATVGWRWIFLVVAAVVCASWWALRGSTQQHTQRAVTVPCWWWTAGASLALLAVSLAGAQSVPLWGAWLAVGLLATGLAAPRLLPPGTWTGRPGLPSSILSRGLLSAAFISAEAYVPLVLTTERGLSATATGWVLTTGAVAWVTGSLVAARLPVLSSPRLRIRLGTTCVAGGVLGTSAAIALDLPLGFAVLGWGVAGAGIGIGFLAATVLTVDQAAEEEIGRTSSALQLDDAILQSLAVALAGSVFAGFADRSPGTGAVLVVGLAAVPALVGLAASARLPPTPPPPVTRTPREPRPAP